MRDKSGRRGRLWILAIAWLTVIPCFFVPRSQAESPESNTGSPESKTGSPEPNGGLRFSFETTPWRTVIGWLADESGLALHVGAVPPGSFTYSDATSYTPEEAIDRVNLFLIPQGFTLVRSGQLISLISLEDPRSVQQLEAMAELVSVEELSQRARHDVVRCLFPLGDTSPRAVLQELSGLSLMTEPLVLAQSNQLLITETAGKLRGVAKMLAGVETPKEKEEVVRRFELKHQTVSDVLSIVRPHLGLQGDELVGLGLSISIGRDNQSIFVTGSEETVSVLDSLIALVDVPGEGRREVEGAALLSHPVEGNNLQAVYEVLQTLLAGEEIRLSMERESNSIVAFAPPVVQQKITATIRELQAPAIDFEVVELVTVDPYFAISLLNEMFGISTGVGGSVDVPTDAPRIDADPGNQRLFVRGKPSQIEQVRSVIAKLERSGERSSRDGVGLRMLPLPSQQARQVLDTAERFWSGANPVIVFPGADDPRSATEAIERTFHSESPAAKKDRSAGHPRLESVNAVDRQSELNDAGQHPENELYSFPEQTSLQSLVSQSTSEGPTAAAMAAAIESGKPLIKTQVTPQGILIQSDDEEALANFEEHLRSIAATVRAGGSPPVVFYLKYVKANDATRMLADLLDGALSLSDSSSGSLVKGYVSGPGAGLFGSFLKTREDATTMTVGSATVVADARLNRLIVQGTVAEIEQIEGYLKIIDKDESVTGVETYGRSRIIELLHTDAQEVAEVIRNAYPGRIAEDAKAAAGAQQGQGDPRTNTSSDASRRDGQRQPEPPKPTRSHEPVLAIAVHPQSNSIVVTAPEPLLAEVEQLARSIDEQSEQDIQVIVPGNPEAVRAALERMMSGQTSRGTSSRTTSRTTSTRSSR